MAFTKLTLALVALLAVSPLALSAPVAVDNSTLISNGQLAQQLNSEFQNLTTSDACNTGEEACIKGQFATCSAEKWQTQRCASGSCFALPNIRSDGVFVACTSQRNAESIIASTGVQGGVSVTSNTTAPFPVVNGTGIADGSNSTSTGDDQDDGDDDDCADDDGDDDQGSDNGNASGTGQNSTDDGSTVTITNFITVPLTGTATFVTTEFVFPSDASSILASATPITTTADASATASVSDSANTTDSASATDSATTPTATPTSSATGAGAVNIGVSSASIIQLTPQPLAAVATPAPASTTAASAESGYSY